VRINHLFLAQIDYAFERIINCFFYFFLVIVAVAILGIDIWTVFLSFNTFFLGFSFLFGAAASNYFEGLLLIFVRRPYDIGDRIATSNPKNDTNPTGSSTWYVERVTLFTTTVRFATTNEVATYSNGSLAILRIINANRSPKAFISISIKFGLETPFKKIGVFRAAVESFIKARPRYARIELLDSF
jgi:small-conductance mechanosensitive channel